MKISTGDIIVATARALTAAGITTFSDEQGGETIAQALVGGPHWDTDFSAAAPGTNELTTQMGTRTWTPTIGADRPGAGQEWPTQDIRYLDLTDEFAYLIRLENTSSAPTQITVRMFLAASEQASDRRMWIELDKFLRALAPHEKRVIYRPFPLSSVVRKPAQRPPGPPPPEPAHDSEPFDYCQCGWPYNFLLPKGTAIGMPFKLMAMITDASYDKLADKHGCGGMSFCGVRCPDARNMEYPFHRPFANNDALTSVQALPNVAVRDLTIRTT